MRYSFKIKSTKSKATFFRSEHFFTSSCRSLGSHKDTGVVCQLNKTAIFIAAPMKKHIEEFKRCFGHFVDRKVVGLVPKYYQFAGDASQVSNFLLTEDKNE